MLAGCQPAIFLESQSAERRVNPVGSLGADSPIGKLQHYFGDRGELRAVEQFVLRRFGVDDEQPRKMRSALPHGVGAHLRAGHGVDQDQGAVDDARELLAAGADKVAVNSAALDDPNSIIATEVFEDAAARSRQESLAEVADVMAVLPNLLAAPPEATVYHVSSSEPAM